MLRYQVSYPFSPSCSPTSHPISAGKMNTTHTHENDAEREEIKDSGSREREGPR